MNVSLQNDLIITHPHKNNRLDTIVLAVFISEWWVTCVLALSYLCFSIVFKCPIMNMDYSLIMESHLLYKSGLLGSIPFHGFFRMSPESVQNGSLDSTFSEKLFEKSCILLQRRTISGLNPMTSSLLAGKCKVEFGKWIITRGSANHSMLWFLELAIFRKKKWMGGEQAPSESLMSKWGPQLPISVITARWVQKDLPCFALPFPLFLYSFLRLRTVWRERASTAYIIFFSKWL